MKRHGSMNRVYRLIWSSVRKVWIPVTEKTRGRGKRACRMLIVATLFLGAVDVQAGGPSGGKVIAGSGSIAQSGAITTVTQESSMLSLTWASFNIAPQESVDFVQPSASAVAVNRIIDTNGTQILGHLNANGQVFLINPNGILFGPGALSNRPSADPSLRRNSRSNCSTQKCTRPKHARFTALIAQPATT